MTRVLWAVAVAAATALPLQAQSWSAGGAVGPFIFGDMAERTTAIGTETGSGTTRSRLSAATRAGTTVDLTHDLNRRFAVGLEANWVRAPLRIKSSSGDTGVTFDAGHVSLTTFVVPLELRLNPNGTFRFHIMAGPAYALYNVHGRGAAGQTFSLFDGTRGRWGGAAGAGVVWWWSRRFGVEWQAQDIITASPFRAGDLAPSPKGVHIPKPQNGHTTIGIRVRF